ncbi:hypothetical protein J6590_056719 [Homalodisca vitripennis]|nr:hypothetical protein J6590_056719 [Homalodisca vitripennis]
MKNGRKKIKERKGFKHARKMLGVHSSGFVTAQNPSPENKSRDLPDQSSDPSGANHYEEICFRASRQASFTILFSVWTEGKKLISQSVSLKHGDMNVSISTTSLPRDLLQGVQSNNHYHSVFRLDGRKNSDFSESVSLKLGDMNVSTTSLPRDLLQGVQTSNVYHSVYRLHRRKNSDFSECKAQTW